MHPYYELAYALASESLCLFVGTGFSKYLTENEAPDWKSLLQSTCNALSHGDELIKELFPSDKVQMPLEECASVISLQMIKEEKSIYKKIAEKISQLKSKSEVAKPIRDFSQKHSLLKFITTNYDLLVENDLLEGNYTSFCPGFPINRQRKFNEVYHIHGSIEKPEGMVVTADDYYRFINYPNYFSKRLDTLLEENTTVIIGYSLGDINLKSILNLHRSLNHKVVNRQHLFYLSRDNIPQHIKDYYDASYGLRVIDSTKIGDFFIALDKKYEEINSSVGKSKENLNGVLNKKLKYTDGYLRKRESFAAILATISSTGHIITHPEIVKFLINTLERKRKFTSENSAWEQYEHLADWLVQLGCIMDLECTELKGPYLKAVQSSFSTMSKTKCLGLSWDAYKIWNSQWGELTFKNRMMIRKFCKSEKITGDHENFITI